MGEEPKTYCDLENGCMICDLLLCSGRKRLQSELSKPDGVTNGDWLRSLSDEGLARKMYEWIGCLYCPIKKECTAGRDDSSDCITNWLEWLGKE